MEQRCEKFGIHENFLTRMSNVSSAQRATRCKANHRNFYGNIKAPDRFNKTIETIPSTVERFDMRVGKDPRGVALAPATQPPALYLCNL